MKKTSIKGGGRRSASYHKMNNNKKLDPIHKPILKGGKISSKQRKNNKTREIYVWRRDLLDKLRWSKPAAKNKIKTRMEICKEGFNTNDGCLCLAVPQTHTQRKTQTGQTERQRNEKNAMEVKESKRK